LGFHGALWDCGQPEGCTPNVNSELCSELIYAAEVFAGAGVDADDGALFDEVGDVDDEAGFEFGVLADVADGGALDGGGQSTIFNSTVLGSSTEKGLPWYMVIWTWVLGLR